MIFVNKKVTATFLKDLLSMMGSQRGILIEGNILTSDMRDFERDKTIDDFRLEKF